MNAQVDFVNGVFDVSARGYRVKLIDGRPATLIRKNVSSRWAKQFGMHGSWGTYPDAPADMLPTIVEFIDEQTRAAYSPAQRTAERQASTSAPGRNRAAHT